MKKEVLGTLLAIMAGIISGVAIPANKLFLVNIDPVLFTAIRSVIIGVIFLFLSFSRDEKPNFKKTKSIWVQLALIAIVGGAFAFMLFFSGLQLTTAGRGAFLQKTLPLFVALLSYFFLREKIDSNLLFGLALMFVGAAVLYQGQIPPGQFWSNPSLGDVLIIAAAFLWAVENVIARKVLAEGEDNYIVSFARMFFGGLIMFGVLILLGKTDLLMNLTFEQVRNIAISTAILFAYVYAWYWSIKLINVSKATTFLLIAPVISFVLGTLFLQEPYSFLQIIGSAIILVGSYLAIKVKSETLERV